MALVWGAMRWLVSAWLVLGLGGSVGVVGVHGEEDTALVGSISTAGVLIPVGSVQGSEEAQSVDLVMFRTHVVDAMVVQRLTRLLRSLGRAPGDRCLSSRPCYDILVVYDSDLLSHRPEAFPGVLEAKGLDASLSAQLGVCPMGLLDFVAYPAVKHHVVSKSHYQHMAFTTCYTRLLFATGQEVEPGAQLPKAVSRSHVLPPAGARGRQTSYRHVWCVEHDVAITGGNWRPILDAHLGMPHHLLSWLVGWTVRADKVHHGGQWNAGFRSGALLRAKTHEVVVHFGPLIRLSHRYMKFVQSNVLLGNNGHSEVVLSTLCNMTNWCTFTNLSESVIGLNNFKLPTSITGDVFDAMEVLFPGKLFHPVRDVGSFSSLNSISDMGNLKDRHHHHTRREANITALCLVENPRPTRPSYSCTMGCPHHLQFTCPTVNCMWGGNETYNHMGVRDCQVLCKQNYDHCPYATATMESVARSKVLAKQHRRHRALR
uniref:Uncharacterized protein n=1 Tax=Rhizochromulina marina TaxID=1034831 RepID=A0A7S2W9Q0_9STRA|mmetsp:Transcript_17810/g.51998  ORF Transcript_17810/g.51998 Transcript_17810/m.51998 type:complete len:486 (+) Transcript_17810:71-1528(+)